ncbi:hypothetical protein DIR38_02210 [Aliarcobacter skirrowii]|nr:hypothetical protein DIR38_02210 [Aliarcobacter skirrowii]
MGVILNFINPNDKNKFLHKFYKNRRKELNIFMQNGKPLFDKYSFDEDNRKKLPKDIKIPPTLAFENEFVKEKFENFGFYQDAITKDTKQSFLFHSNFFEFKNPIPKKIIEAKSGIQILMVGNVYGMSGFSDGGSITTKPYISSSNYLLKMSDYSKNESWCEILDALYWRFLYKYSFKFEKNPRMKMQIALLNKMPKEKLENHLLVAKKFIDDIFITN